MSEPLTTKNSLAEKLRMAEKFETIDESDGHVRLRAADEIDRLTEALAGAYASVNLLTEMHEKAVAEVAELRPDAERYRWLKANHLQTGTDSWIRTGDDLEEAIDEATKERT